MFPLPHARLALSLGAFTLVVCSHIASAQIALDSQLAKPVSPAVEVLLVRHGNDRRVQERWRGAVSHASPDVRATVARAIQMAGAVSLADVLDARLGEETDLRAASEQAASVTAIGGRISDNARQACTRLGAPVAAAVAEALARVAPAVLLSELPTLRGHGPDVDIALAHILRAWLRFAPGQAARLQLALVRAGDEAAWSVVLRAHDDAGLTLGGGPLTTNLSSKHVDVPALGLTHLLHLEEADFTTTVAAPGVRPAIDALGANQTSPAVRLGHALVARRLGTPLPGNWLEDASGVAARSPLRRLGPSGIIGPSKDEATALARAWGVEYSPSRRTSEPSGAAPRTDTTFIADLPAVMLQDTLRETRCHSQFAASVVHAKYGPDGRATTLVVSDDTRASCHDVVGALVSLMPGQPGQEVSVVVPLDPKTPRGFGTRPAVQARYISRAWNAPHPADVDARLVKEVEPTYGNATLRHKFTGEVVFDIVIDETGAVAALEFRQSAHPELNTSAARAIMHMMFSPSRVNGRAVATRSLFSYSFGQ